MIAGIFLCFVLPGILIGLLLAQSYHTAQEKACALKKKTRHGEPTPALCV